MSNKDPQHSEQDQPPGGSKKQVPKQKKPIERRSLTPRFKAVFSAVFSITLISLIGYIALAIIAAINSIDSPILNGVIETLKTAFISGFGAIVGLLGGKAL